jgi:hypothetical protein
MVRGLGAGRGTKGRANWMARIDWLAMLGWAFPFHFPGRLALMSKPGTAVDVGPGIRAGPVAAFGNRAEIPLALPEISVITETYEPRRR